MSIIVAIAAAAAVGQTSLPVLYNPVRSVKDQGIALRAWGSGTVSETDEVAYEGSNSIRVSTRNFFQGAVLDFERPVSIAQAFDDKNNLIRIVYRVADGSVVMGGGAPGGPAGGPMGGAMGGPGGGRAGSGGMMGPGGGRAGSGGMMGPGGGSGMPGLPGGGPGGGAGASAANLSPLRNMRVIVTTSDGKKSEAYVPVTTSGSAVRGWRQAAVPLQAIAGLGATNKEIRSIAVSGDATTTFFLGEVRVVNDTTPLSVTTNVRELNLALNDRVNLIANGQGGASILKYTWDFDSSDGIQVDAEGQTIQRTFRRAGTFTVTVTVSDEFGLKPSASSTIKVTVNP